MTVDTTRWNDLNFIDGQWVASVSSRSIVVENPADGTTVGRVPASRAGDVDAAVEAARAAAHEYSRWSQRDRVALLERIVQTYEENYEQLAQLITAEVGCPITVSRNIQVAAGLRQFVNAGNTLEAFVATADLEGARIVHEAIGVVGLITPWNWPLNLVAGKVAYALAAGCTMVLKPSEVAPLNTNLLAEILHRAGVPAGVFNVVHGTGPEVGAALAAHPDLDMISFTGSTAAGAEVARLAAPTVKRVSQELGGKSANIMLDFDGLAGAVARDTAGLFVNSGQTCNAPTRLLVPIARQAEAVEAAVRVAEQSAVGDPQSSETQVGPLVSAAQLERVRRLVESGVAEGATLAWGGGTPVGLEGEGHYFAPTILSDVTNDMTVAREEVFGPVLVIIGYRDVDEAVRIANDSEYGLAAYVSGDDARVVRDVASRLKAGSVHLNGAPLHPIAPFGGYKRSGNGRERGEYGLRGFLETKSILGV